MSNRSFVFHCLLRVLLISAAFVVGFGIEGHAQQPPDPTPTQAAPTIQTTPAASTTATTTPDKPKYYDSLLLRFLHAFGDGSQDIPKGTWPFNTEPPTDLRKYPAPQNSPPFPYSEYQIGGTPTIGDRNEQTVYPLMKALQDGPDGQWWKDSRIFVTGWVEIGANGSTSQNQPGGNIYGNAPYLYDQIPNSVNLHQLDLHVQRLPDTFQTDHVDWGFRVDSMYGMDYRFTTMKGLFSNQLLVNNQTYGYDMPMIYGDVYIPWVAEGMNIRIGRMISLPDIEAQLAPDNYMFSHSLLYGYDPYTQIGVVTTVKLNKNWQVQVGITSGNDAAPWDPDARVSGLFCLQWTGFGNSDSIYACANTINNAEYAYNNVNQYVATWSHRFSQNFNSQTEAWYMYEKDVPACTGQNVVGGLSTPFGCAPIPGFTHEWAIVNYLNLQVTEKDSFSLRNEFMNDVNGQRTGTATRYYGVGLNWTHFFRQNFFVRPEMVYYTALDNPAFAQGTAWSQLVAAVDLIVRF